VPGRIHGNQAHQRKALDAPPWPQRQLIKRLPRYDTAHAVCDQRKLAPGPQHPLLESAQLVGKIQSVQAGAAAQIIEAENIELDRRGAEAIDDGLQVSRVAAQAVHQDPGRALRVEVCGASAHCI
jgi:hypothetical protein